MLNWFPDRESTTAPKGWATPFIPSLLGTSISILVLFVLWELRRESKGQSVLFPMSMWTQRGTKMGPVFLLVVFGWWGFNTLSYFAPLYYQQVLLLSPIQTSVRLVPLGIAVSIGYIIHRTSADGYNCSCMIGIGDKPSNRVFSCYLPFSNSHHHWSSLYNRKSSFLF